MEIVLDEGHVAEKESSESKESYPEGTADKVIQKEGAVVHFADAGNKRGKGADYGDKAGEDDGFAAVFLVEGFGFGDVFPFNKGNMGIIDDLLAEKVADPVVGGIADNGGGEQDGDDEPDV